MLDLTRYSGSGVAMLREAAPEGSYEERRDRLSGAFQKQFPREEHEPWPWVAYTFADSIIVDTGAGEYIRYPYTEGPGGVTFGEPQPVELVVQVAAEAAQAAEAEATWALDLQEAVWSTAKVNDLPDSSFLYIAPGGEKDEGGKTKPRSLRYFPVKDEAGKVDLPHLRNALSRAPQAKLSQGVIARVIAKARAMLKKEGGEPSGESAHARRFCDEWTPLTEAVKDGTLTLTVIRPGFNAPRSRYYRREALARDHKVFEGQKMYVNHQTRAQERERPEGDMRDWVANLTETYIGPQGEVKGKAIIIDPSFQAKVDLLAERGQLQTLGTSIRAVGQGGDAVVEGQKTFVVEGIPAGRSVDFVTEPGAGGRAEVLEAAQPEYDVDIIDVGRLRERRPDIVSELRTEILRESAGGKEHRMDTVTVEEAARLQKEAEDAKAALEERDKRLAELEAAEGRRQVQEAVGKAVAEAKLSEPIAKRILARFAEATEAPAEAIAAAIKEEQDYAKELAGAGRVRGLGAAGEPTKGTERLVESFKRLGLPEEQAKVAASAGR